VCARKLKIKKLILHTKMDAKVLWPLGGLISVRCATSETSLCHYMVGDQTSVFSCHRPNLFPKRAFAFATCSIA
jgi:hypothetical protein